MTDWSTEYRTVDEATEAALASLEHEQRKLAEVTRTMSEETTTVRSKDRSLTIDFDGRGEVTGITFPGAKYRTMAPAELSHLLVETIAAGRAQCVRKLAEVVGEDLLPGVNFADLASGKVSPEEIFGKVVSPFLDETALGRPAKGGNDNG